MIAYWTWGQNGCIIMKNLQESIWSFIDIENFFYLRGEYTLHIGVRHEPRKKWWRTREKYIRRFLNENEIQERNNLLDEIKSLDYHIHKIKKLINKLEEKRDSLIHRRIRLNIKLKQRDVNFSQYVLDNFNEDELIKILDAFLEYKDYFENPPKEAYEMDNMEYSECKEAHEMEFLLFKYNIFDTQYKDKWNYGKEIL